MSLTLLPKISFRTRSGELSGGISRDMTNGLKNGLKERKGFPERF